MKKLLIGGAAVALAGAPALAQPAPPPPPGVAQGTAPPMRVAPPAEPHVRMMVMSDRVMTRDEVVRHVRELFTRLDTDHDGFVTRAEVEAFHQKLAGMGEMGREMAEKARGMADMGREMAQRIPEVAMPMPDRAAMFDKLDTNHDGVISRDEFMAAKPELRRERVMIMRSDAAATPGQAPMDGNKMEFRFEQHGAMHRMHAGMGFAGHLFEMADTNHDGRVSLAEAEAAALAHFDKADLNHDGKITPEERQQAHALRREHRPS
jgi:Ca2+-binding EF-hand superfamily protein